MVILQHTGWQAEIPADQLALLRRAVPTGIHRAQQRSAAADEAYQDPDKDQHVYGTGMGRGAQKEVAAELKTHPDYRTLPVPASRRALVFLGRQLLFLHRVGPQMPRNATRLRLDYLPDHRRAVLTGASVHRYDPPGLFELTDRPAGDDAAEVHDLLNRLAASIGQETLLAACYSSTPHGIGRILLGPAQLSQGHYLQLIDPEELHYRQLPAATPPTDDGSSRGNGFNRGVRPRTTARLRATPPRQNGT